MSNTKIARRYATALFLNATEGGLDALLGDVQALENTLKQNHSLGNLLRDAAVDSFSKAKVVDKVFANANPLIKNTLLLLCDKRREGSVDDVIVEFYKLYYQKKKLVKATVSSAHPIDSTTEKSISAIVKEKTGANQVEITNNIDKSLLGGFIVRFGDTLIDTSISSQLNKIKKEFKIA